jgi:predicted ATP-dependent endonuclease of OLD family
LDEPDVFLHSDLQRRLVKLLELNKSQVITATHSSEVLGEAETNSVVWVDRTRNKAVYGPEGDTFLDLTRVLGTQFNLRIAKALKSRMVLFLEGSDIKRLKHIAQKCGFNKIVLEEGITIVPLGGYSKKNLLEPFKWLADNFLGKSVIVSAIFDRDYRLKEVVDKEIEDMRENGISLHVWQRKEIENYLLEPKLIARLTGIKEELVMKRMSKFAKLEEPKIFAQMLQAEIAIQSNKSKNSADVIRNFKTKFDKSWKLISKKFYLCSADELLSEINKFLLSNKCKPLSFERLAREIEINEISPEVVNVLGSYEQKLK